MNYEKIVNLMCFLTCKARKVMFTGDANAVGEAVAGALDIQVTRLINSPLSGVGSRP